MHSPARPPRIDDDPPELLMSFARALSAERMSVRAGRRLRGVDLASISTDDPMLELELDFTLEDFIATLTRTGAGAEFMWPGSSAATAGWRLLLVHIDEARDTRLGGLSAVTITMTEEEMQIVDTRDRTIRYW